MKTKMKKSVLGRFAVILGVLIAFTLVFGAKSIRVSTAHAYDQWAVSLTSPDAGNTTSTWCPGVNQTAVVLCATRFTYTTGGKAGSASGNGTVPNASGVVLTSDFTKNFLYDGGNSTTIFGEGIRPNPPAQIQMGDHACIAFGSPDNALDAGTPSCVGWARTQNYGAH